VAARLSVSPAPWVLRLAAWLLPDTDRAQALLGDLIELYQAWRDALGPGRAEGRLAVEVVASLPAILRLALAGRRPAGWGRSVAALVGGVLVCLFPVAIGGSVAGPRPSALAGGLLMLGSGFAGGWLAAAAGRSGRRGRTALVAAMVLACGVGLLARRDQATLAELAPFFLLAGAATLGGETYTRRAS
jgi:hypothetical protein